ncbi:T9SS type A sorting domain-containing protein [Zunongwangia sp. F363]|uniref:T9SS type A sorting domain-containing protein n=1 Tax=Autumnicola tepida TaxID=3075595 RepID=A0ABU3CAQ8_9FLAO|nr:T9SS type A sorting domain-containing protein [Zunongwangia sp. F363]MDT0643428.1 T9SS type A sorting domain-containing protein [Zunongwangia sp. F363]
MKQKYFFSFIIICFLFFALPAEAQDTTSTGHKTEVPISGLSIYPNPVTGGKVYISTTRNLEKEIEIYNVLGKPVKKLRLRGKELDVSALTPGIYILKIEEQNSKATRKLVIK